MKNLLLTISLLAPFLLVAQTNNKGTFKVRKEGKSEIGCAFFPGGEDVLWQFLNKNINFPKTILDSVNTSNDELKIFIRFNIDPSGNTFIKLYRGGNPILVDETNRVSKLMPKWLPREIRGEVQRCVIVLAFKFEFSSNI